MGKIGTFPTKYYHTSFLNDLAVQMGQTELMGKKKNHRKDENILKNSRETSNQKVIV